MGGFRAVKTEVSTLLQEKAWSYEDSQSREEKEAACLEVWPCSHISKLVGEEVGVPLNLSSEGPPRGLLRGPPEAGGRAPKVRDVDTMHYIGGKNSL